MADREQLPTYRLRLHWETAAPRHPALLPFAEMFSRCEPAFARHNSGALLGVQASLVRHCYRLGWVERRLFLQAIRRRRGTSWNAARQVELERQRLGRELHTGVGQVFAAMRLQLEVATAHLPAASPAARQALERVTILVRDGLDQVRSLSRRLHPPEWQRLTLESALRQLWELSGIPEHYQATFAVQPLSEDPPLDVKVLVYRTAQEALSNLARHSQARAVELCLRCRGGSLLLDIRDNGIGFDVEEVLDRPACVNAGLGLRTIREHAAAAGGAMQIHSGPHGTKLELSVPFSPGQS